MGPACLPLTFRAGGARLGSFRQLRNVKGQPVREGEAPAEPYPSPLGEGRVRALLKFQISNSIAASPRLQSPVSSLLPNRDRQVAARLLALPPTPSGSSWRQQLAASLFRLKEVRC